MELTSLLMIFFGVVCGAVFLCGLYFFLYKGHINRVFREPGKKHTRMPPPHRVLFGLAAAVAIVGICLIVSVTKGAGTLKTENDIASDLWKNPGVGESWEVEADMRENLAAGIAFCRETGDYSFGVYIQKGEKPGFVFRYGGKSTSIKESLRAFVYGDEVALISMNALQVAQVRSASGERFYVEPGEPFVLVIPGGGFEFYDAQGNPIPLTQNRWYEVTEIE
ncbi:MAG TPA: hypothetical protein IAB74_00130 [Candidatus Faecousia excrementigallinarum]|uniref:Uncharacterized protein n=1 Tax=Candidatus Faecousia excrementigallinarum TaxID=2840806 RepID=A0A9D1CM39_9FIRM|nr:hypothetical protein [Candidatus Faecousia excrementigallinarum]